MTIKELAAKLSGIAACLPHDEEVKIEVAYRDRDEGCYRARVTDVLLETNDSEVPADWYVSLELDDETYLDPETLDWERPE